MTPASVRSRLAPLLWFGALAGVGAVGTVGCDEAAVEADANERDAGDLDATYASTDDASFDAPPRDAPRAPDVGYDSGAHCDRPDGDDAGAVMACNGHEVLCDRRLDEVAMVMTHNAMASDEDGFHAPNQHRRLWRQLEDGVRGFMLDVWVDDRDDSLQLCHGTCRIGRRPLVEALRDLRLFLDCHPHDVVVIVFEAHAPADRVEQAFVESGLARLVHTPREAGPEHRWPTLRTLIDDDERVIVFTDDRGVRADWHLYTYDWAWENPYAARTPEDLSCAQDRGSRARPLWVFNHFLTSPVASPELAEMINHDPFFTDRVAACRADAAGDLPNFVTVDFYDLGDVFDVVDALNGVAP